MCSVGDKPIGILHYLICWIKDRCIQQAGAIDMLMGIRAMYIYIQYIVSHTVAGQLKAGRRSILIIK